MLYKELIKIRKQDRQELNKIGLELKILRIRAKLSQRNVAKKINRSQNLIHLIETGRKDPGILLISKILKLYGIEVDLLSLLK